MERALHGHSAFGMEIRGRDALLLPHCMDGNLAVGYYVQNLVDFGAFRWRARWSW